MSRELYTLSKLEIKDQITEERRELGRGREKLPVNIWAIEISNNKDRDIY